jgi:hypothetical protein
VLNSLSVFIALITKHAKRMRRITSSLACLTLPYLSTLSNKRHGSGEKVVEHKVRVLILSTPFVRAFSLSSNNRYHERT